VSERETTDRWRVLSIMHSVGGVEHRPEDCPGGDVWPCNRNRQVESWYDDRNPL